jgi:hypothetical protein
VRCRRISWTRATQYISREDAAGAIHRFQEDIYTRRIAVYAIREAEFALAELLIEKHSFGLRLRTLDALQIAVTLRLGEGITIDYFVAADKALCEVADIEGFRVQNPELL